MAETITSAAQPRDLRREEFARLLEERVQRELGMTLEAFLAALDAGELPDTSAAMGLAMLVGARPC
ncbi:MAG TPA: hypothetical protein VII06_11040 [Chloroflexota bacterium]